jgi:K+-sensing histidine kinase KdpD
MELLYDGNALQAGLVPDGDWFKWQNARSIRGYQLSISQHATRIAASFGLMAATTAILFQVHANDEPAPQRLVYLYLLSVVVIAVLYTGRAAMLCAGAAILCADYFLQDPVFSFYTAEWDDLIWFAVLAAFAIKITGSLLPPSSRDMITL